MKIAEALTFATTIICLLGLPTYIGYKLNNVVIGIVVGGFSALAYLLYFAIKRK